MDVNHERFDEYEKRFLEVAEEAELHEGQRPPLGEMTHYLCLYGENGLEPEEEFSLLETLAKQPEGKLKKVEVDADYWQEVVLFVR
jgi:hypothetical protein